MLTRVWKGNRPQLIGLWQDKEISEGHLWWKETSRPTDGVSDRAALEEKRLGALWVLAISTGTRPEEYLALTWSDLGLDYRSSNHSPSPRPGEEGREGREELALRTAQDQKE